MAIIDKLRGVDILSPQLGEEPARETVEWLQDEMEHVVLEPQLQLMLDLAVVRMEGQIWRAVFAGVAILLAALGIATGLIIALN